MTIRRGSKGPDVSRLQADLFALGFDPGPVDGDYGARTATAVHAYQAANGLGSDEIAGPLTLAAIQCSIDRTVIGWPLYPKPTDWIPLLDAHRGEIPLAFLLAWITHESAGNPCSVGIPNTEAGIFQTYHPDDDKFGATFAQLRAGCITGTQKAARPLTPDEAARQVKAGIAYINAAVVATNAQLTACGATWPVTSADFWQLVKLRHALPVFGSVYLGAYKASHGKPPASWREFRTWVEGLSAVRFAAVSAVAGRFADSRGRLFSNAEKTGHHAGEALP